MRKKHYAFLIKKNDKKIFYIMADGGIFLNDKKIGESKEVADEIINEIIKKDSV